MPLIIFILVFIHLIILHISGSSNPIHSKLNIYKINFHPYFSIKDLIRIIIILLLFILINLQNPYIFSNPDNFKIANPIITPLHIKPEWYFLFAYSILRSIPHKLRGVIILFISIFILFFLSLINNNKIKRLKFYPINQYLYWIFINILIILTWLGGQIIEYPFINLNIFFTIIHFNYFIFSFLLNNIYDLIINKNKLN